MATPKSEEKPQRPMRFNDKELSLLKSTFAENDELIMALRKHLYGAKLSDAEKAFVASIAPTTLAVLKKTLTPTIDVDSPLHEYVDLWTNINFKEQSFEKAYFDMQAREVMQDYLDVKLAVLEGKKDVSVTLESLRSMKGKDPEVAAYELSARNNILSHIDVQLFQIKTLAGLKDETVEGTKERLKQNSNK